MRTDIQKNLSYVYLRVIIVVIEANTKGEDRKIWPVGITKN